MLKLATVFSGIGAIEHALKRLGIEHKVVFASDNGGVNIFSLINNKDYESIKKAIDIIDERIHWVENYENDEYTVSLLDHYNAINLQVQELYTLALSVGTKIDDSTLILINLLLDNPIVSKKVKINLPYNREEIPRHMLPFYLFEIKKLYTSRTKPKQKEIIHSLIGISVKAFEEQLKPYIESKESKKINELTKELVDQINMLNERISSLEIHNDLSKIDNYTEKKKYVDNLYKGKEKSNFVKQSYTANYDINDEHFHWNVSFLDGKQYRNQVDLFVGGSPCQSFSLVGKRRGLSDTRGTLFYEFARLVDEIQPKVFIYENVKGLLDHDGGKTWSVMQQVFSDLNYNWKFEVLNAKHYSIPQNRERVFVVGIRNDLQAQSEFVFPKPVPLTRTMKDFLLDNVSGNYYLNDLGVQFVTSEKNLQKRYTQVSGNIQLCQKANQQFNWHGDFVFVEEDKINSEENKSAKVNRYTLSEDTEVYIIKNNDPEKTLKKLEPYFLSEKVEKYVMSPGTKNFYSKPAIDLEIARPILTTMHKMHRAGVDNYITSEGKIRKLTPRECLRLMGFCDSFEITVSDTQMYQQAGNSIVVDVLMAIVKEIANALPEIIKGEGYIYKKEKKKVMKTKVEQDNLVPVPAEQLTLDM